MSMCYLRQSHSWRHHKHKVYDQFMQPRATSVRMRTTRANFLISCASSGNLGRIAIASTDSSRMGSHKLGQPWRLGWTQPHAGHSGQQNPPPVNHGLSVEGGIIQTIYWKKMPGVSLFCSSTFMWKTPTHVHSLRSTFSTRTTKWTNDFFLWSVCTTLRVNLPVSSAWASRYASITLWTKQLGTQLSEEHGMFEAPQYLPKHTTILTRKRNELHTY